MVDARDPHHVVDVRHEVRHVAVDARVLLQIARAELPGLLGPSLDVVLFEVLPHRRPAFRGLLLRVRAEEHRAEVDLDDATLRGDRADLRVGQVPLPVRREVPAGRVRRDHGGLGELEHLARGVVGEVRDVHHDPEAVQLGDGLLPFGAQAVPLPRGRERSVGEAVVLGMGQGDVADPALLEVREGREVAHERRGVLEPHRQRDLPGLRDPPNLGGGARQRELVGAPGGDGLHQVDQPVGFRAGRSTLLGARRDVDRHEAGLEPARLRAGVVEVPVRRGVADVLHLVLEALRKIDVGVHDQDLAGERVRARGEIRAGRRGGATGGTGESEMRENERGRGDENPARDDHHFLHFKGGTAGRGRSSRRSRADRRRGRRDGRGRAGRHGRPRCGRARRAGRRRGCRRRRTAPRGTRRP